MPFGSLSFSFEVDGRVEMDRTLHGYVARVDQWGPFFEALAKDFAEYEGQRFTAEGAFEGEERWADLTEAYAKRKAAAVGDKPILQRTGALLAAVTAPDKQIDPSAGSGQAQMTLTIDSAYAVYHDSMRERTSSLPRRGIVVLSSRRKTRWTRLLRNYIWDET